MTGDVVSPVKSDDSLEKTFGFAFGSYRRVDLHAEVRYLATSPDVGKAQPAQLRTGVHIADVVGLILDQIRRYIRTDFLSERIRKVLVSL